MKTVFLTGMPGAGKTHWGRIWSREYGFVFYDLDDLIEHKAGTSIPAIINAIGEPGFRALESDVLLETLSRSREENALISCGGGTPVIERNLRLMQRTGCVVYLRASPEILLKQLRQSAVVRPLLTDLSLESLAALLDKRKNAYEQADIIVPLDTAQPGTFAEILEACINRH